MRFQELLRFRREKHSGAVPEEVVRQLQLPMPDDVLEQFILDHGVNGDFQEQYGKLDLHAIRWVLTPMMAREFLLASIFEQFQDWAMAVAERTRCVAGEGWDDVNLPATVKEHWKSHGTWMRSPIVLCGDVIKSKRPLHLVEGHTRLGALKGLVEAGVLAEESAHLVWLGHRCDPPVQDGPWREVLRREGVTFQDWLMRQFDRDQNLRTIAGRLVTVKCSHPRKVRGDDLEAVLQFARGDEVLRPLEAVIRRAHKTWERFVSP
jgi:hypothetical protein